MKEINYKTALYLSEYLKNNGASAFMLPFTIRNKVITDSDILSYNLNESSSIMVYSRKGVNYGYQR